MLFIFFFLFKQKTAYEVRISDWSSDVCSSDLQVRRGREGGKPSLPARSNEGITNKCSFYEFLYSKSLLLSEGNREGFPPSLGHLTCGRSEERRVAKEWVSPCRSRWAAGRQKTRQK